MVKCNSEATLQQLARNNSQIDKQVDQLHIMRNEMIDKARDILSRKDDSTYLGRNMVMDG